MNTPDILIDEYEQRACAAEESGRPTEATECQLIASIMTKWRDCLIKIASCQGGMASHQAQDLLTDAGYCDHAGAIYKAQYSGKANAWTCSDCGKASPERLVPYR